ncbi:MAG: GH39 family glycosyl hydrolase, partial [Chitinophagaceae bacterium]
MNDDFICGVTSQSSPFPHYWEHTIGSGHATLALRADWQRQLLRCHQELGFKNVRFHGILSDNMGTLVCENDRLIYSFFNADQVFDFLNSIGMHPFVELSFMPLTLSSGPTTVFRYRGNVTPPKEYAEWEVLIFKIVQHWVTRYGLEKVRNWYFEIWNEPNLAAFWTGSQQD